MIEVPSLDYLVRVDVIPIFKEIRLKGVFLWVLVFRVVFYRG